MKYKQHMDNYQIVGAPLVIRGHFSNAHHELRKMISPLKLEKHSLIEFWQLKNAKTEENIFISILYFVYFSLSIL
jgi:hypothetical protein